MGTEMAAIPIIDVGDGGPNSPCGAGARRAKALADACSDSCLAGPALCAGVGRIARRWVTRSASPFVAEIAQIAEILGFPGVWLLNATYNWGCTAVAREENGAPWLARTLDWPFPGLGRHVEVVRARGARGRLLQCYLARLRRRSDGNGPAPVRGLHQSGADAASHPPSAAAHLRPDRQRPQYMGQYPLHAAGSTASPRI